MILRILRTLLIAAGLVAIPFFATNPVLFSAQQVTSADRQVSPKDLQITCAGPAVLAGGTTGTSVTSFKRTGTSLISYSFGAPSGSTLVSAKGTKLTGYGVRQDSSARYKSSGSISVLDSTGSIQQGSQLLTVNQLQLVKNKKIRGLLGAPCLRARSEFWLVGGSVAVGREALLVLTNPSQVDATVDLDIYTENGVAHTAGLSGISVPAGKTEVLPLAAFVFRAESLAVHVKSIGGSITALIQQKAVRGLGASGADYVSPTTDSALESVIPGILVRGSEDSTKLRKEDDKYSDVQQLLRVFVPGDKDAQLVFEVLGTDPKTFGTVLSVTAPAGKVTDFKIKGLADGDYVGYLKSDVKVFGSVRLVRSKASSGRFTDFAWINPAEGFTTPRFIAVPKAGISKLSIVNPSSEPTTVSIQFGSQTIKRNVAAGSEIVLTAPAAQSVGIFPTNKAVYANLVVDVTGRIAVLPVLDEKNIGGQVLVSVH
jgi:hypothetical protein